MSMGGQITDGIRQYAPRRPL